VNQEKPKSIEIHKILHLLACKQIESEQATHPKRAKKQNKTKQNHGTNHKVKPK
jgi:hypothetical protein